MGKHRSKESFAELRGPRPWTQEEARRVIDAWEGSGETVAAFARNEGLVAHRIYWWRSRFGVDRGDVVDRGDGPAASVSALVPVTIRTPSQAHGGAAVTVCTRDGVRVEVAELDGVSAAWVATFVRSLGEVPS